MKSYAIILLASLSFLSGCKQEKLSTSRGDVSSQKDQITLYKERKAEATAEVKKTAEEKAEAPVKVDLTPLRGYTLTNLNATYLGLKAGNKAPPSITVSFDEVMSQLYNKKVNIEICKKNKKDCKEATETVLSQMPKLYANYLSNDKQKMNVKSFVNVADGKIARAKKSLDWKRVCKRYELKKDNKKLSQQKCRVLQSVVAKIAGKDMVAYGMTELLPSSEGKFNLLYLDILLNNAGAEFLYHVPALGDELASLGFYQFTMYALRKDEDVTEGASIINSFVKDGGEKIPDSVVHLKGSEHHVAAFYFAVHNLSRLVFSLSDKGLKNLVAKHQNYQDEIVMYVAAAHHAPGTAHKKTVRWINSGMKSSLITSYKGYRIHEYALKTKANLLAVYGRS